MIDTAVVLAAGRGTRMQRAHAGAELSADQAAVASTGLKAMMPVGRPFIDYVLSGLADAGFRRVCLVVGPNHDTLREHVQSYRGERFQVDFCIQQEALGTANAVAAAEACVNGESFLLVNSDNYYPLSALQALRAASGPAVAGFRPAGLLRGNISSERLRNYALLAVDSAGYMQTVLEKPAEDVALGSDSLISMNCWRFSPAIFEACRAIAPSVRGEFEITDAVTYAIQNLNERFQVVIVDEPVFDLSTRADVAELARRLAGIEVRV